MSLVRLGEYYFNDANLFLQGWQSCASCHPDGAQADGFNWDQLNDGIGNPKNARNLLLSYDLHDGSAATMRDVLTTRNPNDEHGVTKGLTEQELNDLCEYVLSL